MILLREFLNLCPVLFERLKIGFHKSENQGGSMKRISLMLLALILLTLSMVSCMKQTHHDINDIDRYGQWENSERRSSLYLFPESIENINVVEYYYEFQQISVISPSYLIFLKCQYDQTTFETALRGVSQVAYVSNGKEAKVIYDETHFQLPAYVAVYENDLFFEYVLIDEERQMLLFVFLQYTDIEIPFDKQFLPKTWRQESDFNFSIYATNNAVS